MFAQGVFEWVGRQPALPLCHIQQAINAALQRPLTLLPLGLLPPATSFVLCRVKEAMLDSANERIAELKSAAAAADEAAEEARLAAEEVEEELRAREGNDSDKQHSLRCVRWRGQQQWLSCQGAGRLCKACFSRLYSSDGSGLHGSWLSILVWMGVERCTPESQLLLHVGVLIHPACPPSKRCNC